MKTSTTIKKTLTGLKYAVVNSENISEIPKLLDDDESIRGLSISKQYGYGDSNLSVLQDIRSIEWLAIVDEYGDLSDISNVYDLINLEHLQFSSPRDIDITRFNSLIEFRGRWPKDPAVLNDCTILKKLYLSKGSKKNIAEEFSLLELESLELIQCQLESLQGLQYQLKLESLEIGYCAKLSNISQLKALRNLKRVFFSRCKRVVDFSSLENTINLAQLSIAHCGSIQDLIFLEKLKELEILTFFGTQVTSNNLSPIEACTQIKELGFNNKKSYNKTLEELRCNFGISDKIKY